MLCRWCMIMLNEAHTHTPGFQDMCDFLSQYEVIILPAPVRSLVARNDPLEDDQRSRNHPVAIFWNEKKIWGSPSAMEHAYTVLILEFFFGETLWGLILRDILSWLEVMCHWSLRKLITWLSFNGLYKNIGAKNTSSVRFSLLLCSKQIPIWSIQMFNASLHARCFFTVLSRDDPRTSHKQWTESHPGPPTVFTVHGLIGMLYWVPKVDN